MSNLLLIKNYDIVKKLSDQSDEVSLDENLFEVLFSYKEKMLSKFGDIKGTFLIDHFALHIIDQENKILTFSASPSVEYNLFSQGLWKHDKSFSLRFQQENRFYCWEKAYDHNYFNAIKQIKELNHGFNFGFNLSKKIESSQLIYSFATRSKINNLFDYYREYVNELFAIGDYVYKHIHISYTKKTGKKLITPPLTNDHDKEHRISSPFLKLISFTNTKRNHK